MNTNRAIEILERLSDPEAWEPKITAQAAEAINMGLEALKRAENDEAEKAILRENIKILNIKLSRQEGIIEALKFSIRCNSVSGDSVKDGPL